jgi:hypothetical protein
MVLVLAMKRATRQSSPQRHGPAEPFYLLRRKTIQQSPSRTVAHETLPKAYRQHESCLQT